MDGMQQWKDISEKVRRGTLLKFHCTISKSSLYFRKETRVMRKNGRRTAIFIIYVTSVLGES
jgi:hypothetical protein